MEHKNYLNKSITKLIKSNGNIITDPDEILDEQKDYYEHLYASQKPDVNNSKFGPFFKNDNIPKLKNQQKGNCDGLLTLEECWSALKGFKKNKSPPQGPSRPSVP